MIGRKYIDPTAIERVPDRRVSLLSERLETTDEQDEAAEREAEALLAMRRESLDRLLQRIPPVLEATMRLHLLSLDDEGNRLNQQEIARLTGVCQPTVCYRLKAGAVALQRTLALKVDLTPTEVATYVQNRTASPSCGRCVSLYWRWHTANVRRVLGPLEAPSQSTLYEQVFGGRVGGSKGFTVRFPRDPVSEALLTIRSWGGWSGARPPGFNTSSIEPPLV